MSKLTEADLHEISRALWSSDLDGRKRDRIELELRQAVQAAGLYAEPAPAPAPVTWRETCGRCRWWGDTETGNLSRWCNQHGRWKSPWDWCSRYDETAASLRKAMAREEEA